MSVLIYLILVGFLTSSGYSESLVWNFVPPATSYRGLQPPVEIIANTQECGGLLEADNGVLEVQPSKSSCIWIIKLQSMTGINLELKHSTMEPFIVIPEQNSPQPDLESMWIIGPRSVYKFEGEMLAIVVPPRSQKGSLSWAGLTMSYSDVTLNPKFGRNSEGIMQWKRRSEGTDKLFWAIEPEATGKFKWELSSYLPYCEDADSCVCMTFWVIHVMPDGSLSNTKKTCEGTSLGSLTVEKNSKMLVLLRISSSGNARSKLQVEWEADGKPVKRRVTGLLVGTEAGLYVVTLNPLKNIRVSANPINGVAFDWKSQKMYYAERFVGIMRAKLDGSSFERVIADSWAVGVGIDSVTGNLYYGSNSRTSLRVCNNDGENCSTLINLTGNIYDLALHSSKGFLFWSIHEITTFRANLDGSSITEIAKGQWYGISVDEAQDRFCASSYSAKAIFCYDLNGSDMRTLQIVPGSPDDTELDSSKVYYLNWDSKSLHSRSTLIQDTSSISIAEFPSNVRYIALFGEKLSFSRSNPCENAKCSHLCALNTVSSFRCLCPDGEYLQEDGTSCLRQSSI